MDPVNGAPQSWAQKCFFMCTYALFVQTCLTLAVPLVLGGTAKIQEGAIEGDVEYGGLDRYRAVAAALSVGETVREFLKQDTTLLKQTMDCCKGTIAFCPMLAILFVGCRMRALLITDNKGAPQGWAQDGMYMATWAVLIQFLMTLIVPLAFGSGREVDNDGTLVWKPKHPILVWVAWGLKWLTFIFLYGGVIAVIVAVYTMSPETANGRGSVPLVGDGKVPLVDEKVPMYDGIGEPPGANDIPGVSPQQGGAASD